MLKRIGSFQVAILALVAAVAAVEVAMAPRLPAMYPDSSLYLNYSSTVPAAYPLFLSAVGVPHLAAIQILLYAAGVALLALAVWELTSSRLVAVAATLAMFVNPQVYGFETSVLSEGLFLPLDLAFLAALLAFLASRGAWLLIASALIAGVAATVRPISLPLLIVVMAAAVMAGGGWRRRTALALACAAVWLAPVAAEKAYTRWLHGGEVAGLAGQHLFAKGALVEAPPLNASRLNPLERSLAQVSEQTYRPVRDLLRRSRGTPAYQTLLAFYEVCLQHACADDLRRQAGVPAPAFNRAMAHVGRERLMANPGGYLRLTLDEYRSLWVINSRTHPSLAPRFDAYIAAARPLPLEDKIDPHLVEPTQASRIAYVVRPAFTAAGVLTALILFGFGWLAASRRGDGVAEAAFLGALSTELVFAFNAFAGIGDGRYTMGMWPNIGLTLLLAAWAVLRLLAKRFPQRLRTEDRAE